MKVLVIGIGSIGERHIRNLRTLGVEDLFVYDNKADVFRPDTGIPDLPPQVSKMQYIVQKYDAHYYQPNQLHEKMDAFVVCTPPAYHTEYVIEGLSHHIHVFVEKPISNSLQYLDWVESRSTANNLIVQVGYQMRFDPELALLKHRLDKSKDILSIQAEYGQYLPSWHPNDDYTKSYTAQSEAGGGIILDASHEIDYVRWLAGSEVKSVSCMAKHASNLMIDVEDLAEITLQFENGVIGHIHLDMIQKEYVRRVTVIGNNSDETVTWKKQIPVLDPYVEEMRQFLDCVKTGSKPLVDAHEGIQVLRIALAAKQSAAEGRIIEL